MKLFIVCLLTILLLCAGGFWAGKSTGFGADCERQYEKESPAWHACIQQLTQGNYRLLEEIR